MKNFLIFFFAVVFISNAWADNNAFTGNYTNQIAFHFGQGIDSGWIVPPPARFVPFYMFHLQYSQPTTFFKIPARQSINIGQTVGFGTKYRWQWDRYSIPMIFLSEDISLLEYKKIYVAAGGGGGLQVKQNRRIGSKLLFQFKITSGYRINDKTNLELFMQHFSNGNTAPENYSYAFYGCGITYSF